MMMYFLLFSLIFLSMMFTVMNHPLAMGLMLMMMTVIICLSTGLLAKTFWFSYILFLIFLGGMLVLFIYTTSLASNEMFTLSNKLFLMFIFMMLIMMLTFWISDNSFLQNHFYNLENLNLNLKNSFYPEDYFSLYKLYNYPTNMITMMLMIYLLMTLIAAVKITNLFFGPLRMSS